MPDQLFVVSDCCPVGCGAEVVVLRRRDSGALFAYCDACGCAFVDAVAAQFSTGLNTIISAADAAPKGVEFPRQEDLANTGFSSAALRSIPAAAWGTSVADLNTAIEGELSTRERGRG
jgi:hypothetical protein